MITSTWLACSLLIASAVSIDSQTSGVQAEDSLPQEIAAPASTGVPKFVAIVLEHTGRHHIRWGDTEVALWEICPDRIDTPVVRRHTLGRSRWNATPLLDSPSLLRWQVPKSTSGFEVRLLRVDYSTFEVTQLQVSDRLQALGQWGDKIYFNTSGEPKVLDVESGVLTLQAKSMQRLATHGADWLVEVDGVLARFDAAEANIVRSYAEIALDPAPVFAMRPQWDGGRYAAGLGSFSNEDGAQIVGLDFGKWRSSIAIFVSGILSRGRSASFGSEFKHVADRGCPSFR